MTIDLNAIYLPREVAAILKCSKTNVYDLIGSRKLPSTRVGAGGKGYRVRGVDLQEFLTPPCVPAAPPRMEYRLLGL